MERDDLINLINDIDGMCDMFASNLDGDEIQACEQYSRDIVEIIKDIPIMGQSMLTVGMVFKNMLQAAVTLSDKKVREDKAKRKEDFLTKRIF